MHSTAVPLVSFHIVSALIITPLSWIMPVCDQNVEGRHQQFWSTGSGPRHCHMVDIYGSLAIFDRWLKCFFFNFAFNSDNTMPS